jgi:TRAP transporter TAXI family solute receptor
MRARGTRTVRAGVAALTALGAAAVTALALAAVPAAAQRPDAPVTLAFATLGQGTAWYIYGATIADVLRKTLPPGSNVDVKPFSGGVGNVKLVARNETPIGLSFTVTNRWAAEGTEAYDARIDNVRALVGGLDTYYLVVVAAKKLGLASLKDVKDKKLPVKAISLQVGSLGEFAMRQLLREYGLTYADIKSYGGTAAHAGYNVIVDAFRDGRADLLVAVATPKHPSISEIATFTDVQFLPIEPERVKGLSALGYKAATLPPDTFKNQARAVPTVGFPTVLIANKDLAEPVAYTITKSVIENKEALVRGHAGLGEFDPATSWQPDEVGLPLHPGAARAYREKGWMK